MPADAVQPSRSTGSSVLLPAQADLDPSSSSEPAAFQFDDPSRASHSEQPVPLGGVPRALREAAEMSGLDPIAELYNEALRYASEGHLRLGRERLQMLLCMAPDDGEARLLLAKIHVAGQKWQDALAALDEAQACGMPVPSSLRRAVEDHLRAEEAATDEQRAALRAREQGEVKTLRQEARRLRSENAHLVGRCAELERETRKWAWSTAGVSSLAILFIGMSLLFGGGSAEAEPAEELAATVPTADAPASPAAPASEAPRSTASIASQAANALSAAPGLDGTTLEVEVAGGKATVSGEVQSHQQLRTASRVLSGVSGIHEVDVSRVEITAVTKGTTHVVVRGDTLSHIAQQYYGDSTRAQAILKANKGTTPSNLRIGQELRIPPVR